MDARPAGSIVLTASVLAFDPAPTHFATHAYAAAKAAIIGLATAAAATYADQGVRLNAIAPGLVATPMAARAAADPGVMAFAASKQPLAGGMLDADDVVDAAVYLCSRASRRVTGQTLTVDGGWSVRGEVR
jgi:NAD(P)-dependent dehydrogenase (short-subunit alcohol dehydrogenase family)